MDGNPDRGRSLVDLEVVLADCQATGPASGNGHLLELAWLVTRASAADGATPPVESRLVRLPRGAVVPPRVTALTGISRKELTPSAGAVAPDALWRSFAAAAPEPGAPLVAHYARYEEPFLRRLHETAADGSQFPFEPICTHEIARRLLPDLPRRGLHALAGYFGHATPELKRSTAHVLATAVVWRHLVERLADGPGVTTLAALAEWIASSAPSPRGRRVYPMARELRLDLPDSPGVYRFLGGAGEVLYVGKATSLHRRVNSYFQKRAGASERTLELVTRARAIDATPTATALEAALLETDEIKRHEPPLNVALRSRGRTKEPLFASPDFVSLRSRPDAAHTIGPVARGDSLTTVAGVAALLDPATDPEDRRRLWEDLFRFAGAIGPVEEMFEAGLGEFRARHDLASSGGSTSELVRLGGILWLERLRTPEAVPVEGDDDDDDADEEGDDPLAPLEPGRVADALDGFLRHAAKVVRRGRWLAWVSESTVAFQSTSEVPRQRILVIENGSVTSALDLAAGEPAPSPRRPDRSFQSRQRSIDRATFDRLRVLTTELKGILRNGGEAEVVLGPGRRIGGERLKNWLRWV